MKGLHRRSGLRPFCGFLGGDLALSESLRDCVKRRFQSMCRDNGEAWKSLPASYLCGLGFLKKRYIESNKADLMSWTNVVRHAMLRQFMELFLESRQSENCFLIPLAIEIFHFVDLKVEEIKELSFGFGKAFEKPRVCIK